MFKTKITELLGIEYPIVQGGMLWISTAEMASAVSNAGGLGVIASANFSSPQELRQEIQKARTLTSKPFGVNIAFLPAAKPRDHAAFIQASVEEGVKVFETAGSNPEPYMKLLKADGARVIHKTTAVRFAQTAQNSGVDAVAMVGQGAAGHPGMDLVSSMVLIPAAVDALRIPVIAAGEIADARGFVAALALGAQGILMGTRFMATQESNIHPKVKAWLVQSRETDTLLIQKSVRNTARVRTSDLAYKILGMESQNVKLEDLLPLISGTRGKELNQTGDLNAGLLACGQVIGLIDHIPTVKQVIDSIINDARIIKKSLASMTG
ncbi:MAG: nitronate monooxygenase [Dehalococcoidia bacterium]|nr:nitronate monooxygenase [Dehalococcoidia bacterium]